MPTATEALPGRSQPIATAAVHYVNKHPLKGPYPDGFETAVFGLGCFWGAERKFWQAGPGVYVTAVGYAGGFTGQPDLAKRPARAGRDTRKLCWSSTIPKVISYEALLKLFWESHDPTQGMRQGNDVGSQDRSAIFATTPEQLAMAQASGRAYGEALKGRGFGDITTEIAEAGPFHFAEDYHQQYLAKNPAGYCGLGGTGVSCPIGVGVSAH